MQKFPGTDQWTDDDDGDTHNHLAYGASKERRGNGPGCYSGSFATQADTNAAIRWASGQKISRAGAGSSGSYFTTPPQRFIMFQDRGFSDETNNNDTSDHQDGKWNAVFLDGHVSHFNIPNPGRNWQTPWVLASGML